MNIQELRDKVIEKIKDFHLSIKETEDIVFDLFAEFNRSQKSFPKENQASENPLDKYDIQYSPFELVENLRKDMQKEIEPIQKEIFELYCFRKKFGECLDDQRNDLSLLKKHILDLQDELLTLKRDLKFEKEQEKPKQERFYYQVYVERKDVVPHGYKYEIIDRKNVFISENIYTENQAVEVCLFLNSLAKGE